MSSDQPSLETPKVYRRVAERPASRRETGATRLSEPELYDVVGNTRRRACVEYLLDTSGETAVSDLVSHVVSVEYDQQDTARRKSVYASLRQTHLPKLASLDVINYDPDQNVVTEAQNLEAFEPVQPHRPPQLGSWPWTFVVLGLISIGWFAAGLFDLIALTHQHFLLVSFGYVLLVFLEGLYEVQQLRSELAHSVDRN